MKKWILAALVAALFCNVGCEAPEAEQGDDQADEQAAAEAATQEEAPEPAVDDSAGADEDKKAAGPVEDLEDGKTGEYGADFSIEGEPIALAAALEKAKDSEGPYKIAGEIEKVCKKKGCWFTFTGDDVEQPVRVRMKDYGFFVPRNSDGGTAVVEGTLQKRVVPQAEAQHYADDEVSGTDKAPRKVEGDQERWEMKITAARVTNEAQ